MISHAHSKLQMTNVKQLRLSPGKLHRSIMNVAKLLEEDSRQRLSSICKSEITRIHLDFPFS